MAKRPSGARGCKADPKNPILFSYTPRNGEKCVSDSGHVPSHSRLEHITNDSTENVTGYQTKPNAALVKKKKEKKLKRKHSDNNFPPDLSKPHTLSKITRSSSRLNSDEPSYLSLPPEMLVKIFSYVVDCEGSLPFLCRAARVCKLWHETSYQPCLWRSIDLSYLGMKCKKFYLDCLSNRLSQCRSVNLSLCKNVKDIWVKTLVEICPSLRSINLSGCGMITPKALQFIADRCPQLEQIDLTSVMGSALCPVSHDYFLEKVGGALTYFKTGDISQKSYNTLLLNISASCSHLQHLEITNLTWPDNVALNIEQLQAGCPELRILRFLNFSVYFTPTTGSVQEQSLGFPQLEELRIVAYTTSKIYEPASRNEDSISRLLKTSSKLRILDVRDWAFNTYHSLIDIPASAIEHLLLANNWSEVYYDYELDLVIAKWGESLVELDLSWNNYTDHALKAAIESLTTPPSGSCLEVLNLDGTVVGHNSVRAVVESCHKLKTLKLSSCCDLPRKMRCEHWGKEGLTKLWRNICK